MFLIRVIPLGKLPPRAPAILDYFWPQALAPGALVRTVMGTRTISAVVVESTDVRTAKLALKRAGFELRKISAVIAAAPQMTAHQMRLAQWIAVQYACSPATALATVASPFIGKTRSLLDHSVVPVLPTAPVTQGSLFTTEPKTARALIADILRQSGSQVLIMTPDRIVAHALATSLGDASLVYSGMPAAHHRAIYRGVLQGTVRVVIGTRSALFLPWSSLTHVIVEDPLNELYKSDGAPRYNAPDVARQLAAFHGAELVWLTPALSTVQYHLQQAGKLSVEHRKPSWPHVSVSTAQLEAEAGRRSLFSRESTEAILDAYERRSPLLVLSARRAYATVVRCTRCATPVPCGTCDIPMRWHRTSEDLLVCYHCAAYRSVPTQCGVCRAGTLKPSGIPGSQKLAEAIGTVLDRSGFPKLSVPVLDSDLIHEPADARRVFAELDAMRTPMLVATSMINSHRYDRAFDTIIVPHVDMLSSNPDYRSHDRLIMQLEKLADFMPRRLILQTYADEELPALAIDRNWNAYFAGELAHRRTLRWPPFTRLVKLSYHHRDRAVSSRAAALCAERLSRAVAHTRTTGLQILGPAASLTEHGGGKWTHTVVLKSTLPPGRLAEFLQYVPDGWVIDVDPRSIA